MTDLAFQIAGQRGRLGLKGPRAAEWLGAQGIVLPTVPNTWTVSSDVAAGDAADVAAGGEGLLVARLGSAEYFLEDDAAGTTLRKIVPTPEMYPRGVYPVLREDAAFTLSGAGSLDVLAQVCSVNFAELSLDSRPVIMTMMMGVAALVLPQDVVATRQYRIWCDPTFGAYLGETLGAVVVECGGRYGDGPHARGQAMRG
jgi:sarcosine oxidase subunit gamma